MNTVCWLNCGSVDEVAALVADVAAVGVVKLPRRNPFSSGPLYRAFERAVASAWLALDADLEFQVNARRWLRS